MKHRYTMDGIEIAGIIVGSAIPTYAALYKIYFMQGKHDEKLKNHNNRLNSIEKKIDTLNGNTKKSR